MKKVPVTGSLEKLWEVLGAKPDDMKQVVSAFSRSVHDARAAEHLKTLSPDEQAAALAKRAARRGGMTNGY